MKNKRSLLIKIGTVFALLVIAGVMMIIGRGHTVYIDNKTLEYDGQSYSAYQKVKAFVNGEQVANLSKRERGMATWIGQDFKMELEITEKKGDEPVKHNVSINLPYSLDGIVINIPGYFADNLPQDVYITEFVSLMPTDEEVEEIVTDEFGFIGSEE